MTPDQVEVVFNTEKKKIKVFISEFAKEFLRRVMARTPVLTGLLQRSYKIIMRDNGFDIDNDQDYLLDVEYGLGKGNRKPAAMIRTTLNEVDDIAAVAKQKAGITD